MFLVFIKVMGSVLVELLDVWDTIKVRVGEGEVGGIEGYRLGFFFSFEVCRKFGRLSICEC